MYKMQVQERAINATEQGDLDDLNTAIKLGANINEVPWGTESLLMRAIRCGHEEVAKYLISAGIDVNYIYVKSDSPREATGDRHETARDYAEFYKMHHVLEMLNAKQAAQSQSP
ncbi:uncharacterized protein [Diadema antillarum]|uniref:uncharacterized protein n=1 Tax=Diadema antillarum TaxID=105358 RepID=UPI003A8BD785